MDMSENPPRVDPNRYKLINSIKVRIVPLDDPSMRVYQWDNHGDISYLLQTLYLDWATMSKEKTMYIYWLVQPTIDPNFVY